MDPYQLSISEASDLLQRREISAVELTTSVLERIATTEAALGAYVAVTEDLAREQAVQAEARRSRGEAEALTGIPICHKDVLATAGVPTTCGSRMLERFVPPYDATVVSRMKAAGVVMVGKGNMDEFAMGSSTENSALHPTRNPWDLSRVPGGSSGGSAAAVAAGQALGATGSDTGGSIRQPAAFCGITGLKPTYGRVSRFGLVAFASSLDQVGPLARTARDCAMLLQAMAGHDPNDSTSADIPVPDYVAALTGEVRGLRIGVPSEYFPDDLDANVRSAIEEALAVFEHAGAQIVRDISLPSTRYAVATYYILAPSEASANLARYDGVKYGYSYQDGGGMWENMEKTRELGFGSEVKRRIMLATYALSAGYYDAYYLRAQRVRTLIRREFEAAFQRCDVLLGPTTPTVAFPLGAKIDDPLQMYLNDVFTIPVNIAALPGISIPCGFVEGLPVGLQLIGRAFDEETLLRAADAYQRLTDWHQRRPDVRVEEISA
ncbi:MAG TPA: Asp-tRNA(Asn)/Glu-tRNA(Gln) amidotransferase subunit GatA [Dehalococcoidia bacterium]|nr:Asp-tRNA(Asn)/Glu-tRNA(Gln) amidotransferase subunit GatA [Dehalococcoidia bacterium]